MHENRETSGAPRSIQDRGRSEKAQSRTSDMHAREESDRTIVPVNQPNKEDESSAEVGEGGVRAKENIVQSDTSPIQSGERVSQGLRGVREVLLKGMSSKKHFSPPERRKYCFDIQPPALVATVVLQLLDRFAPLRSGPLGRGATGLGCFFVRVVSCSLT